MALALKLEKGEILVGIHSGGRITRSVIKGCYAQGF